MNMLHEKQEILKNTLKQIEKEFGKGAIMSFGDKKESLNAVSTGSVSLNAALGVGGLPKGRIVEIYGPESSGKTTLALHTVAEVQKQGGVAAFIDVEYALDPKYSKTLGVDIDSLLISQPDNGEEALDIADSLVKSGVVDVVVVDSVAALVPKAEIDGEMGDAQIGLQARLMSKAMRKLTGSISKSDCLIIFINQLREKVGVMFGSPEVTPGGRALKFYSSVRLEVRKIETLKNSEGIFGARTRVKVVKNKLAPPFKEAIFDILYGKGICKESEVLTLALKHGIVEKNGAWFYYNKQRLGQGRDKVTDILCNNTELCKEIEGKLNQLSQKEVEASAS